MSISRRFATILLSSAAAWTAIMSSCTTEPASATGSTLHSNPAPKTSLDGSIIEADRHDGSVADDATAPTDPFERLDFLYSSGRIAEARLFYRTEVLATADVMENRSLLRMWRGRLYLQRWTGQEMGLAGENISAILTDSDDIWMGTWTGGLSRFSTPLADTTAWDPGLPSLAVRTVNRILRDGNRIAIVRYGEIQTYDRKNGSWKGMRGLPVGERLQDYRRIEGAEYLATLGDGLWRKRSSDWEHLSYPGLFINRIEEGNEGELLIATMDRGVYAFDTAVGTWIRPPADSGVRYLNVTSVLAIGSLVVCGTYGDGAFIWDRNDGSVRILDTELLGDAWVLALEENRGRIYFATFGAGLAVWNISDDIWEHFGIEDGLPTSDLASLAVAEDGALWIGTLGGGIVRMEHGIHGD